MNVGLISCVKNKVDYRSAAKDLYISDLFLKSKKYAEKHYNNYFILSALHGLLDSEEEIDPYEYTLIGKSSEIKKEWSSRVVDQIKSKLPNNKIEIYIHAGNDYRKYLVPLLEAKGFKVEVPLKGLGIGEQKAWYLKESKSGD